MVRILIADPDPDSLEALRAVLDQEGTEVLVAATGERALELALEGDLDVILAESQLPGVDGLSLLQQLQQRCPETAVILTTAFGTVEDAVVAMREGASDFLSKPCSSEQIRLSIDRSVQHAQLVKENHELRVALDERTGLDNLIATDASMRHVFKTVRAVADTRTTVLITGESGTGKTLLARAIHNYSKRATGPFVEVNCGALPESLLESELFGHTKGAFTGAHRDRPGKFEAANGGTIFLDEIGTSTPSFQVKLLRVLQDRVVERLGDSQPIQVDVRVVLATNADLAAAVQEGTFREDLYYRINVVAVEMPPLRDRRDDIPYLAEHFLRRFATEVDKPITGFTREAMHELMTAALPGNVRQLENLVERAVVLAEGTVIEVDDLPPDLRPTVDPIEPTSAIVPADAHLLPLKEAMEIPERVIIQRALSAFDGNRQKTAASLGINRSTLFNKMRKFGLL